jgi:hypothetical protein
MTNFATQRVLFACKHPEQPCKSVAGVKRQTGVLPYREIRDQKNGRCIRYPAVPRAD